MATEKTTVMRDFQNVIGAIDCMHSHKITLYREAVNHIQQSGSLSLRNHVRTKQLESVGFISIHCITIVTNGDFLVCTVGSYTKN